MLAGAWWQGWHFSKHAWHCAVAVCRDSSGPPTGFVYERDMLHDELHSMRAASGCSGTCTCLACAVTGEPADDCPCCSCSVPEHAADATANRSVPWRECGPACACWPDSCHRSRCGSGVRVPVRVHKRCKGWELRAGTLVCAGQCVCMYGGEYLRTEEAVRRLRGYDAAHVGHALLVRRCRFQLECLSLNNWSLRGCPIIAVLSNLGCTGFKSSDERSHHVVMISTASCRNDRAASLCPATSPREPPLLCACAQRRFGITKTEIEITKTERTRGTCAASAGGPAMAALPAGGHAHQH